MPEKHKRKLRLWDGLLGAALFIGLAGCAAPSPPLPPSLELPTPAADLQAVRKGNTVLLSWTQPLETTDREGIRFLGPTRICRSLLLLAQDNAQDQMTECGTPAAEVTSSQLETTKPKTAANGPARVNAQYADVLPAHWMRDPKASVTYAIESLNTNRRSAGLSNEVHVPAAATEPPPEDFRGQLTDEGAVLTWTGPLLSIADSAPHYFYRVYRVSNDSQQRTLVGETLQGTQDRMRMLDGNLIWEKTYEYRINLTTRVSMGPRHPCPGQTSGLPLCIDSVDVEGEDSPPLTMVAHDVFPPAVPSGLQAVFSGAGQKPFIDLTWNANTDSDLAGYNIYRREGTGGLTRISPEPVKAPAFRDTNVASGKTYFYAVTAIDLRANESAHSAETSEQAP